MTDDALNKIAEPAAKKAAALPRYVKRILIGLCALFMMCVGVLAWVLVSQHQQITALSQQATANASAGQQLADQVRKLGGVPVVQPEAGPAGTPGAQGTPGAPGTPGATGRPGQAGASGQKGDTGATGPTGPSGPPGVPGAAGTNGSDGTNGADGQDGANGPAGPAGAAGPPGPQGEPGPSGAPGADGADGEPPYGWTYTDDLGIEHTCTRTADFDPQSPTYTCSTGG